MTNPSNGVAVYDHVADDDPESITITDAMTPSEVIAALVDAYGVDYVATLGEAIRRMKRDGMRKDTRNADRTI